MATRPPAIRRPNGRLYRPGSVRAHLWGDEDDDRTVHRWGYHVLGTHDVELTRAVAAEAMALSFSDHPEATIMRPRPGRWLRLRFERCDPVWEEDEEHGAAAVTFHVEPGPQNDRTHEPAFH
ncbi:MAG: hypothetical protein HOV94_05350 [Saccharothrix sp.]|nr:hypothetical protein [Saccharothrix sp.]